MFSPYYAWRGRRDAENHCALNVALYGPQARWAMTERGKSAVERGSEALRLGPSRLGWRDGVLVIEVAEIGAPLPRPIRGTIRVTPQAQPALAFDLDAAGRHRWQPIAPLARIDVDLDRPNLRWSGSAYLDSNRGDEPLENGFASWTWSRAHGAGGCKILYDAKPLDGPDMAMALDCRADGSVMPLEAPPERTLPSTLWRIGRTTRADAGRACIVEKTLEDTPFYARSLLRTTVGGEEMQAFHESLSLERFRSPIVKAMLPFRMPRRGFL